MRGLCDPLATPRPLGPVRDVLAELGASELAELPASPTRDDVEALVVSVVSREPTTVVVEDVQWIDEASVEALRYLVRRIDALPVLLVLTYRDAEIGTGHPLRPLLGDLARLENSEVVALAPLSVEAVSTLLRGTDLDAAGVHRLTGVTPSTSARSVATRLAGCPHRCATPCWPAPTGCTDGDLEVLQLVATAPDAVDDRLMPLLGVDMPCLRRLDATGLLVRTRRGIGFRHELARRAVRAAVRSGSRADCTPDCSTRSSRSGRATTPCSTHHAEAAARPDADEPVCRPGRRGRGTRGVRTRRQSRSSRSPSNAATPRGSARAHARGTWPGAVHGEPAR